MFQAPAPVAEQRPIVVGSVKKKTGLIPMEPDSSHAIKIAAGTREERRIYVKARDPYSVVGASVSFVCLHEGCYGKRWKSLAELYAAHPSPEAMRKAEAVHVFGQWSDDPANEEAIEGLDRAANEAEARAKKAEERAAKVVDDYSDQAERTRESATNARKRADEAHRAVLAARAPIGLIAPPDLRPEEK